MLNRRIYWLTSKGVLSSFETILKSFNVFTGRLHDPLVVMMVSRKGCFLTISDVSKALSKYLLVNFHEWLNGLEDLKVQTFKTAHISIHFDTS